VEFTAYLKSVVIPYVRARITPAAAGERGAAMVEYALLVALIAVVCLVAIAFLGTSTSHKFSTVGSQLS
jgi:pilus assembly protein Flp/PilA